MTLPSWQDKKFGGMIRAALWLETEVGLGNIFTKAALRQAFPEATQIDRRIRDLRDRGWQIDTSRHDPSLSQDEQRYVKRGAPVWIPGQAKVPEHKSSLSAAQRTRIHQADGYLCRACGIGAGETYEDGIEQAFLFPVFNPVAESDAFLERPYPFFGDQAANEVFVPAAQAVSPLEFTPFDSFAKSTINEQVAAAIAGSQTMDEAAAEIQRILVGYAESVGLTVTEG